MLLEGIGSMPGVQVSDPCLALHEGFWNRVQGFGILTPNNGERYGKEHGIWNRNLGCSIGVLSNFHVL